MYCPITIINIDLLLVGYFLPAIKKLGHKHLIHDAVKTLFCRFISFYTAKSVLLDSKKEQLPVITVLSSSLGLIVFSRY